MSKLVDSFVDIYGDPIRINGDGSRRMFDRKGDPIRFPLVPAVDQYFNRIAETFGITISDLARGYLYTYGVLIREAESEFYFEFYFEIYFGYFGLVWPRQRALHLALMQAPYLTAPMHLTAELVEKGFA